MDSFRDAQDSYDKRQSVVVLDGENSSKFWGSGDKFKANHSDSKSFEVTELLQDQEDLFLDRLFIQYDQELLQDQEELFLDRLFDQYNQEFIQASDDSDKIDYDTSWLFGNLQGLYFEDDNIDHRQLEDLVQFRKENKLYSIFLKEPKLVPTPKRKLSPQEQTVHKLRRMTIAAETSPTLRTPRRRLQKTASQGSRSLSRRVRERESSQGQQQKQPLIPGFFIIKKNLKNDQNEF